MSLRRFNVDGLELVLFDVPPLRLPDGCELSTGECEVVELIFEGLSTGEIAKRRRTSTKTVSNQLGNIYRKFAVTSRYELVAKLAQPDLPNDSHQH